MPKLRSSYSTKQHEAKNPQPPGILNGIVIPFDMTSADKFGVGMDYISLIMEDATNDNYNSEHIAQFIERFERHNPRIHPSIFAITVKHNTHMYMYFNKKSMQYLDASLLL